MPPAIFGLGPGNGLAEDSGVEEPEVTPGTGMDTDGGDGELLTVGDVGVLCLSDPGALADEEASSDGVGDAAGVVMIAVVDKGASFSRGVPE